MRSLVLVFVLGITACTGGSPPEIGLPPCSMDLYDPCFSEHGCKSNVCRPFGSGSDVFSACTIPCTAGDNSSCMSGSATGTCGASGFCEPAAANKCSPEP